MKVVGSRKEAAERRWRNKHSLTNFRFFKYQEQYLVYAAALAAAKLCPTLCDPVDSSPPGSPIPGILQARTLEWVAISSPMCENEVTQLYLTLSDPMDCSLLGSSVHGIFQARVLEWGANAFSD